MNETWGPCFRKRDWLCRSSYSRQRLSLFMLRIFSCFCLMSLLFLFVYLFIACGHVCGIVHMLTSESILSFHRVDPGAQVIIYVYLFIACGHVCSMMHILTSESILSFIVWTLGLRLTSLAAEPSCWPSVLLLMWEKFGERNEVTSEGTWASLNLMHAVETLWSYDNQAAIVILLLNCFPH